MLLRCIPHGLTIQSKRQSGTRIDQNQNALKSLGALIAAFVFCTLQIHAQAEDFTYTINAGAVNIIGYTGPGGEVVIPSSIAGLPVVHFGTAFAQRSDLTSVIIPDTVTAIGSWRVLWVLEPRQHRYWQRCDHD